MADVGLRDRFDTSVADVAERSKEIERETCIMGQDSHLKKTARYLHCELVTAALSEHIWKNNMHTELLCVLRFCWFRSLHYRGQIGGGGELLWSWDGLSA